MAMNIQVHQQTTFSNGNNNSNGYLSEDDGLNEIVGNDDAKLFERSRILVLADERETIQKKTFTKWINSHIVKDGDQIQDLFVDLRDGKVLLKLLSILTGDAVPEPTKGRMRIHCMENVNKSLNLLKELHVYLENVGAHDIVDGNSRLTLGLIWTIILRFQIQDVIQLQPSDTGNVKNALLLWCQMKTAGYSHCNVRNFTTSWRDGLAFCAIIHKHRPDLLDYNKLRVIKVKENLELAFTIAESLGIYRLLEVRDVDVDFPDERSIITYVAKYYDYFTRMHSDKVQSKRIAKVVNECLSIEQMIVNYEKLVSNLLQWIKDTIVLLNSREFVNSLTGVQNQLSIFNIYRTTEKPSKFQEKGRLEILLFQIQATIRAQNQRDYIPYRDNLIGDINHAWIKLEKAEHNREIALREELLRQEKLEILSKRLLQKSILRESWLEENYRILTTSDQFGTDVASVEAALKKHETIVAEIRSYEERITTIIQLCNILVKENYHQVNFLVEKKEKILKSWQDLFGLLEERRKRIHCALACQRMFAEMQYLLDWMVELRNRLTIEDYGKHLMGVEDLLQKHDLILADIRILQKRVQKIVQQSKESSEFTIDNWTPCDPQLIHNRADALLKASELLEELGKKRLNDLNQSKKIWLWFWDMDQQEQWIKEHLQILSSPDVGHDIGSVNRLLRKHKLLEENEIKNHELLFQQSIKNGQNLLSEQHQQQVEQLAPILRQRIEDLQQLWKQLVNVTTVRRYQLKCSQEWHQLINDCEDADVWMIDLLRQIKTQDIDSSAVTAAAAAGTNNKKFIIEKNLLHLEIIEKESMEFVKTLRQLEITSEIVSIFTLPIPTSADKRIKQLNERYQQLIKQLQLQKQKLIDLLTIDEIDSVSDMLVTWIIEKEKLLTTFQPIDDIDQLIVLKQRFYFLESNVNQQAERVHFVNNTSKTIITINDEIQEKKVQQDVNQLNDQWNEFINKLELKRNELLSAILFNEFLLNCHETQQWIKEKCLLIESTDELDDDLDGIIKLQRRLGSLQRDRDVIRAKLEDLHGISRELIKTRAEEKQRIENEINNVEHWWNELTDMLQKRDVRLNRSSELQRFLQDLDHFQMWLSRTQSILATEDIPISLEDTEKQKLELINLIKEIDLFKLEFSRLISFGREITKGQTHSQYVFLNQRLNALEESWNSLHEMITARQRFLDECFSVQCFYRDASQVDVLLKKFDIFLAKEELPTTLASAHEAIRHHKSFLTTMKASEDRISKVLSTGEIHVSRNILQSDRIKAKCDQMKERHAALQQKALDRLNQLNQLLKLQEFNQEADDVEEWIAERLLIVGDMITTTIVSKNLAVQYSKFRAFEDELAANKGKVDRVILDGERLALSDTNLAIVIEPRLVELRKQWSELNETVIRKGAQIAESNREKLFTETANNVLNCLNTISEQIITEEEEIEETTSLIKIRQKEALLDKKERELVENQKRLEDMKTHAKILSEKYPERANEFKEREILIETRLTSLTSPLTKNRDQIQQKRHLGQLTRDLQDEREWILEKLRILDNNSLSNVDDSLLFVQQSLRRLKLLRSEVEFHRPQLDRVFLTIDKYQEENHPKANDFLSLKWELEDLWQRLLNALNSRKTSLKEQELVKQYFADALEAKLWMSSKETILQRQEKAKNEEAASKDIKKHNELLNSIIQFETEIQQLEERIQQIEKLEISSIIFNKIKETQLNLEEQYQQLKQLALKWKLRLIEILKYYHLLKETQDLEEWINERILISNSHDVGVDLEQCNLLIVRFEEFNVTTKSNGGNRVNTINDFAHYLIQQGHEDAAELAEWIDRINEIWADLLELIETRNELLLKAKKYHEFYSECLDMTQFILEKSNLISIEMNSIEIIAGGTNAKTLRLLQRQHKTLEDELLRLKPIVDLILKNADNLMLFYAGEKLKGIIEKCNQLSDAWNLLIQNAEERKMKLIYDGEYYRFLAMFRELCAWMAAIRKEIMWTEKPKDVSGVELLMNSYKSYQAEIDARAENFSICLNLGRTLLHRGHVRQAEIREMCKDLVISRLRVEDEWNAHWEQLLLMLEVFQFARDAAVAEAWLIGQETYLTNPNLGDDIDETITLLKKHQEFEKALVAHEERFRSLEKLTKFEVIERQRTPEMEAQQQRKRERRIEEAIREFQPPPSPIVDHKLSSSVNTSVLSEPIEKSSSPNKPTSSNPNSPPESPIQRAIPVEVPVETPKQLQRESSSASRKVQLNIKGVLSRKHEWQESGKKSSSRTWHDLFIVLRSDDGTLVSYKDERHANTKPSAYYRNEGPTLLHNAYAAPANDYGKRENVFRLKLPNGGEYLFQATNSKEMHEWVRSINAVARGSRRPSLSGSGAAPSPTSSPRSKYATLPNKFEDKEHGSSTSSPLTPSNKKKFFTMTRKK